jgi:homocysteine S-methyltransferase
MTQPVFTADLARKVIDACSGIDIKIFMGVFPLISSRNAEFMENEVPGISIPPAIRERISAAPDKASARRTGLDIATALIDEIKDEIDGLYLISPLNRWSLPLELVKYVRAGER